MARGTQGENGAAGGQAQGANFPLCRGEFIRLGGGRLANEFAPTGIGMRLPSLRPLSRERERGAQPYWQASQSGLSMLQACGTGAGFGSALGRLSSITEDTALSLPVLMVDFSVLVAARARR